MNIEKGHSMSILLAWEFCVFQQQRLLKVLRQIFLIVVFHLTSQVFYPMLSLGCYS